MTLKVMFAITNKLIELKEIEYFFGGEKQKTKNKKSKRKVNWGRGACDK